MLKEIRLNEIIRLENKDYIIVNTNHKNGKINWEQPTLIQLEHFIKSTPKKLRGCCKKSVPFRKFKGIKLTSEIIK